MDNSEYVSQTVNNNAPDIIILCNTGHHDRRHYDTTVFHKREYPTLENALDILGQRQWQQD